MFLLGLLIGIVIMYLIAGVIVYMQATPLNRWFFSEKGTGLEAILIWPVTTNRLMRAGLEHEESQDLKPRPAP